MIPIEAYNIRGLDLHHFWSQLLNDSNSKIHSLHFSSSDLKTLLLWQLFQSSFLQENVLFDRVGFQLDQRWEANCWPLKLQIDTITTIAPLFKKLFQVVTKTAFFSIKVIWTYVTDKVWGFEEGCCYTLNCILMRFPKANVIGKITQTIRSVSGPSDSVENCY